MWGMLGSSPLTRGKRATSGEFVERVKAHPRSRGENVKSRAYAATQTGSSPLTRGKPRLCVVNLIMCGLIPAHAGKTTSVRCQLDNVWAHPRSRGENDALSGASSAWKGSSPLTRGKQGADGGAHGRPGLIPAHAGKTVARRRPTRPVSAHPRSRGENPSLRKARSHSRGSSPLTRGKHGGQVGDVFPPGLIPAHAGKTSS